MLPLSLFIQAGTDAPALAFAAPLFMCRMVFGRPPKDPEVLVLVLCLVVAVVAAVADDDDEPCWLARCVDLRSFS